MHNPVWAQPVNWRVTPLHLSRLQATRQVLAQEVGREIGRDDRFFIIPKGERGTALFEVRMGTGYGTRLALYIARFKDKKGRSVNLVVDGRDVVKLK